MQVIAANENNYILSFAHGEELFPELISWAIDNKITGGTLTGLGASDSLEIAYYNLDQKKYERHQILEEVEILSLTGNLGLLKGEHVLHIHGVFGRRDLSTIGGHLFQLTLSGACEIHFTAIPGPLNRAYDEQTGLNLLCKS